MGYDVTRFQGEVDEDLLCPICSGVLEEPVQASPCWNYTQLYPVVLFYNVCIAFTCISGPTL